MEHSVESEIKEAGEDLEKLKKLVRDKDKEITQQNEAITDLTGLYEREREKNKKLQEEIIRLKSELKKCQEKQQELENELKKSQEEKSKKKENNTTSSSWIEGEYKWMPMDSTMPEGWVKVNIEKGYALVYGDNKEEKTTLGEPKKHSHKYGDNSQCMWIIENGALNFYHAPGTGNGRDYIPVAKNYGDISTKTETNNKGNILSEKNLVAGICAELWQYQGTKEKTGQIIDKKADL